MNDRIVKVRALLEKNSLDAAIISSIPNIIYITGFDHFTYHEREAFLLITKKTNYIVTDKRYTHAVQTHIKDFTLLEIFYGHGLDEWMKKIAEEEHIKTVGIEEDNLTYAEYKKITPAIKEIRPLNLSSLRIKKSEEEIGVLQKACAITDKAFMHVLNKLKPGLTEQDLALEIEGFIKKNRADLSFETIVAYDENAAFIHHKTGDRALKQNSLILLDFGAKYNNYCADESRTIVFGKATTEQKKAHQTVLTAQELAVEFIEKKLSKGEPIEGAAVDKIAREYIMDQGYPSFSHGLGHGVGLQVHEPPSLRPPSQSILTDGMVFSIEPGIYIPRKFGVRIEDIYTIEKNNLIRLTKSPKELIEI